MRSRPSLARRSVATAIAASLLAPSLVVPAPIGDMAAHAARGPKRPKPPKFEDNCKPLRKPFTDIDNYQTGQIIKGVFLGALIGLVMGALAQSGRREVYVRDRKGRVVKKREGGNDIGTYVVGGAVAGGLAGYLTSIEQNRQNQQALQTALAGFDREREQYGRLPQALAELGNCRNVQVFTVQQQFEASTIDAIEAGRRLDLIDKWVADDDKKIADAA